MKAVHAEVVAVAKRDIPTVWTSIYDHGVATIFEEPWISLFEALCFGEQISGRVCLCGNPSIRGVRVIRGEYGSSRDMAVLECDICERTLTSFNLV